MADARIVTEQAGPLTSLQDNGRPGWRRFGVPPSGPVDRRAFAAAQAALGNPPDAAAIELSHGGIAFRCEGAGMVIALTGAATAEVDGVVIGGWCLAAIADGSRCRVRVDGGNWGYVAFAGRLSAPVWLGSHSTHFIAELGGGRLAGGRTLTVMGAREDIALTAIERPAGVAPKAICVVIGPQDRFFEDVTVAMLTSEGFAASARFDRMGMVLDGPSLPPVRIDMPSEPAVRGALQVDGDGRVSLLSADHQTTGGYPRIAVVIDQDIDPVMQFAAGTSLRFEAVDASTAITLRRAAAARDAEWLGRIAASRAARPSLFSVNLISGVVDALR